MVLQLIPALILGTLPQLAKRLVLLTLLHQQLMLLRLILFTMVQMFHYN